MGINPDLQKERDNCSFNVSELTNIIHNGPENAKRQRELAEIVSDDPILGNGDFHRIFLSKSDRYERALQKFARWLDLSKKHEWSEQDNQIILRNLNLDIGVTVHMIMFIPAIQQLASDEQKRKWLPLAESFHIIGTYCQTELGHGTDLRHLETRVNYDPGTEQFVINTPDVSSMKWWPGGLGLSANHVLLMAQLYIKGKNYGLQAFMVQIRDVKTHLPLPGVEMGAIGPSMSSTTTDNGYLRLKDIRIPRENMLMKFNEVTPEGIFKSKGSSHSSYGTMIFLRANICGTAWVHLSCATTISTRYSAVRHQSKLAPGQPEPQILDYQTQQMKLFPNMAACFAIFFTHRYMLQTYEEVSQQMAAGDISRLPELHIQSAGFKALTTDIASEGAEVLRRACGGHGYLLSSGLPAMVAELSASVTYEGENTVLYLQVARYLMKQLTKAQEGSAVDSSLHFLRNPFQSTPITEKSSLCMADVDTMLQAFDRRTQYFLTEVGQKIHSDLMGGLQMHEAWNRSLVNLVRVAKIYLDGCMVHIFHKAMSEAVCSPELKAVLFRLFYFHMVHRIVLQNGEFLQCGALKVDQLKAIKREEIRVLPLLRPDAVGIMDAFNYTDNILASTLGRFDGNVYEALYQSAKKSPLNASKVHPAVEKYLLPIVNKAKL